MQPDQLRDDPGGGSPSSDPRLATSVDRAVLVIAKRQGIEDEVARQRLHAAARRWAVDPSEIARGVLLFEDD